jgi:mannosyl-oligosaccharide glucosidase
VFEADQHFRSQSCRRAMKRLSSALIVLLAALLVLRVRGAPPLWSTYRPHALISARARVPHSPSFGIMYHDATSFDAVRHLTADDHGGSIRSFAFTRHDAQSFADHKVEDVGLNAVISSSFVNHRADGGRADGKDEAWTLRVSGTALDPSRDTGKVSVVFYASAGPDELDAAATDAIERGGEAPWGTIKLSDKQSLRASGISGDCVIDGYASSVGGPYRVVVRVPNIGGLSARERIRFSSTGRRRRRSRAEVSLAAVNFSAFHVSAPLIDTRRSFLVDELLRIKLRQSEQQQHHVEQSTNADEQHRVGVHTLVNEIEEGAPIMLVQRIVELPLEMEIVFVMRKSRSNAQVSAIVDELSGEKLDKILAERRAGFDAKFEKAFGLGQRGYSAKDADFARTALANTLGGIGYFYGSTVVAEEGGTTSLLEPVGLLTSTPSRANFPRGFLWDEGFHQLLVQKWDPVLSRVCLSSWLGLMDPSGWIPREQVLGIEARHRFPSHVKDLMIQKRTVANPPTLLMPLRVFAVANAALNTTSKVDSTAMGGDDVTCAALSSPDLCSPLSSADNGASSAFWLESLNKAVTSFQWLRDTQAGEKDGSFRWRGRTMKLKAPEGYPLTLASGLDDYPRGEVPHDYERHLDLHSWLAWAAGTLAEMHRAAGRPTEEFDLLRAQLVASLEVHHKQVLGDKQSGRESSPHLLCDFDGEKSICNDGYVVILPLLLGLLENDSPRVGAILELLENTRALRSPAGVRSLSIESPFYRKGDDYWTGSVWMPFNYLTMAALHSKYGNQDGPYRERSASLYASLKDDVLSNARRVFEKTGYLWENFSPDDGSGKSGRQFTGWSALVVLMYADIYDGVL